MIRLDVTPDLVLRSVEGNDAEALFRLVDANRDYLREWLPWLDVNRCVDDTRAFIRESQERARDDLGHVFMIVERGALAGTIGFNWLDPLNRSTEIGYWLGADHQGRGIVTRCVRALLDHAFFERDLHRVIIPVAVGNSKSRAIPERLGFRREGIQREAGWLYGRYVDLVLHAMLRSEWETLRER